MPAPDVAIRLRNVSKFYKLYDSKRDRFREAFDLRRRKRHHEFYALRGIDLEVKKGEILGIVGRNGAGKSTLLKILSGVIQANDGRVEVNGRVSALLELGSGLNPNLDGIQNIYFGGIMMGFSREEMKRRLDGIVAFADIGEFIRQPMRTYSSGMRARLGFALAVNVSPDILIIDEVLSVGDELFRRKCYAKMEELFRMNCTVLYVTHNTGTINELCSRAVFIDEGEVILDGSPKFVTLNYEKYLFGSPDTRRAFRKELLSLNRDQDKEKAVGRPDGDSLLGDVELDDLGEVEPVQQATGSEACIHEAVFLEEFLSDSKAVFQTEKIDFIDVHIETEDGRRVNYLFPNEVYILEYRVRFFTDAEDIALSCVFKTEKGLVLSGVKFPGFRKTLDKVKKNTLYSVKFKFRCGFLPGIFFVDVGVVNLTNGRKRILSAEYDSLVFKVQRCKCMREKISTWGHFSLEPQIEILEESIP